MRHCAFKIIVALVLGVLIPQLLLADGLMVANGLTQEHQVERGQVYKGEIILQNLTKKEKIVKLYLHDYRYLASGEVFYDPPASTARSNAAWLYLANERIVVAAESKLHIPYQITVPDSLTQAGTYWSLLMVEEDTPVSLQDTLSEGFHIRTKVRYGIQIVCNVQGEYKKDLEFGNFKLEQDEEQSHHLFFDVLNTGTLLLHPKVNVELFNIDGQSVAVFDEKCPKLYPGTSAKVQIPLKADVPAGKYKSLILIDTGEDDVFATEIDVIINP